MLLNVTTRLFNSFRRNEDGQDLLEYALLVALIAIVAVTAVTAAGVEVDAIFQDIVDKLPLGTRVLVRPVGVRRGVVTMADPLEFDLRQVFPGGDHDLRFEPLSKRDDGQDLIEYAMLASLIAIFALATVSVLASQITDVFWGAIAALDF